MQVTIRKECGYDLALMGMAYSYKDRALDVDDWWEGQRERAVKRSSLLAPMSGGHNKFLRQIILYVDISAPRSFWSEFDTYKVGTVAQSESTMHTLAKRLPTKEDFEEGTTQATVNCFIEQWAELKGNITALKENMPEGYLQRRLVTMSYDNVRNILVQRQKHRYKRWGEFCKQLYEQLEHKEFVEDVYNVDRNE